MKKTENIKTLEIRKCAASSVEKKIFKFLQENFGHPVRVDLVNEPLTFEIRSGSEYGNGHIIVRDKARHNTEYLFCSILAADNEWDQKQWKFRVRRSSFGRISIAFTPYNAVKKTKVEVGTYKHPQDTILSASVWAVSTAIDNPAADVKCKCRLRYYDVKHDCLRTVSVDVDVTNRKFLNKGEDITPWFVNANEVFDNLKLTINEVPQ